jgi:hypothetical protein
VSEERFNRIEVRLDGIDSRLDGIDGRLDGIDGQLGDLKRHMLVLHEQVIDTIKTIPDRGPAARSA